MPNVSSIVTRSCMPRSAARRPVWANTLPAAATATYRAAVRTVAGLGPLPLLWLDIGETPNITLVAIGAFFPVHPNRLGGAGPRRPPPCRGRHAYGRTGAL